MAIIAVLVAISIPVFTFQLHKARVATDWANVRAYYAELQYDFMETEKIDENKLREPGPDGPIKSFNLSGQEVKLQAGCLYIRQNDIDGKQDITFYIFAKMEILNVNWSCLKIKHILSNLQCHKHCRFSFLL